MSHCFVNGCELQVIGGFVERTSRPDHDDPQDTLPGMKTGWCKTHEPDAREHIALFGRSGRYVTSKELE